MVLAHIARHAQRAKGSGMDIETHTTATHDGWRLTMHRGVRRRPTGRPVLFVPGFGMNGYIFRYHPATRRFMEHLLDACLDPWSVDMRGTRSSVGPTGSIGLADMAFIDLPAAFEHIRRSTGHEVVHAT
jgi:pimeloyl-ACP methyl ester carboxylesterase